MYAFPLAGKDVWTRSGTVFVSFGVLQQLAVDDADSGQVSYKKRCSSRAGDSCGGPFLSGCGMVMVIHSLHFSATSNVYSN